MKLNKYSKIQFHSFSANLAAQTSVEHQARRASRQLENRKWRHTKALKLIPCTFVDEILWRHRSVMSQRSVMTSQKCYEVTEVLWRYRSVMTLQKCYDNDINLVFSGYGDIACLSKLIEDVNFLLKRSCLKYWKYYFRNLKTCWSL